MTTERARCVDPTAIAETDLLAYARGEGDATATGHIARCAACRQQAAAYTKTERVLQTRLFRRSCPPSLTIGEYALDVLPAEERQRVAAHIVECPHCAVERREFSAFLAAPDEPLPARGVLGALRRLLAQPLRPSASALAGLRGSSGKESTTYAAEGVHLTVSVQRGGPRARGGVIVGLLQGVPDVVGMLHGDDQLESGSAVNLYDGDTLLQSGEVDDLGNFLFENVPTGTYRIEVTVPESIVVIDPVHVT